MSPLLGVGAGFASAGFASAAGLSGAAALSCASVTPANASDSSTVRNAHSFFIMFSLKRGRIGFAGADADDLLELEHEDLAVADLAGVRRFFDGLDRLLEHLRLDRCLDLHLGEEVDDILGAAIELGVALLPAKALYFRDGDALHADRGQRFADFVELEGFDDCRYEFHAGLHWAAARPPRWPQDRKST